LVDYEVDEDDEVLLVKLSVFENSMVSISKPLVVEGVNEGTPHED
jgi:hypothetical protein